MITPILPSLGTVASIEWLAPGDLAIKSTIILAAAWTAVLVMRRASSATRHLVWVLAVVATLTLPLLSGLVPQWQVLPAWFGRYDPGAATIPLAESKPAVPAVVVPTKESPSPADAFAPAVTVGPINRDIADAGVAAASSPPRHIDLLAVAPKAVIAPPHDSVWASVRRWATIVWAMGTAILALPILVSFVGLWRMGRRLPRVEGGDWESQARELLTSLRIERSVTLLRGRPRAMPMTWGILHPKLVLPPEAEEWPAQRRRVVLMHEMAHIKRGDFVVQFIVQLARAIYWFNPLMWVASRQIALESEGACDDLVLGSETRPSDYAEHLLAIATGLKEEFLLSTAAVAMARSSRLKARLVGILDGRRNRSRLTASRVAILGSLLTAVILPVAAMRASNAIPWAQQHGWASQDVQPATLASPLGGWRNLPFSISNGEEANARACIKLAEKSRETLNGQNQFYRAETRTELERILSTRRGYFYAEFLLGLWHQGNGDSKEAERWMELAYKDAPVVVVQRFVFADQSPLSNVVVQSFALECNRIENGSLDPSLRLYYPNVRTDSGGCIYFPVYNTVYRTDSMASPEGYDVVWPKPGWFETSAKVAVLPTAIVARSAQPAASQPSAKAGFVDSAVPAEMQPREVVSRRGATSKAEYFTQLARGLRQLASERLANSTFTLGDDGIIHIQWRPRQYDVHRPTSKAGGIAELRQETGPAADGLILTVWLSEEIGQAARPQTVDNDGKWKTLLGEADVPEFKALVEFNLEYGPQTDAELLKTFGTPALWLAAADEKAGSGAKGELSGTVTDEAGKPLAGVLLHVWSWCDGIQTHTDENGRYVLKKLGSDSVEIRVGKDGFDPWYSAQQPTGVGLNLKLSKRTYFDGTVVGPDGEPVAGALVRAYSKTKRTADSLDVNLWIDAHSDANGRYRLYAMPDSYTVLVRVPKVGTVKLPELTIADGQAKPLDIHLTPGVAFRAQVVDNRTGEPVPNVTLAQWKHPGIEGVSDKDGNLIIETMDAGKFQFNISANGYARWWSAQATENHQRKETGNGWHRNFDDLDFDIEPDMKPVRIELERAVRIIGVVLDPDGNPVAGATVAPAHTGTGNSLAGDTRFSVVSKNDGTFDLTLPASGDAKYNLEAHDGAYGQWRKWANGINEPIQTKPGDLIDCVLIKLTRPVSVSGTVKDETGKPIAGRQVRASAADRMENRYYDPTTETDENGEFTLKFVRPGDHFIQAAPFWSAEESDGKNSIRITLKEGQPARSGVNLIAAKSTRFPTVEEQIRRAIEKSNQKENAHPDLTNLKGAWRVRSLQGMPVFRWMQTAVGDVIHIDNVSTVPTPPEGPPLHDYYTISLSADPKEMDVTFWVDNLWQTSHGIYRLDGDTLTICMAPYNENTRPTEFKPGTGTLIEFVRMQPNEPKAAAPATRPADHTGVAPATQPTLAYGPITDGLQLALDLEAAGNRIAMGKPITARLHFRNAGSIPITLHNPNLWQPSSDEFIVTDSNGKKVQTYSTWFSGLDVGHDDTLAAGQSVGVSTNAIAFYPEPFDGSKVHHPVGSYAFLKPGKYKVQYKLRAPTVGANPAAWQGELASAPMPIEVVAAPPVPATAPASGLPAKAVGATRIIMTVTDAATNKPIPNAKIAMGYDYVVKSLQTDRQGQATLQIDAGHRLEFWARVSAPDHVGQLVRWSAPKPVDGQAATPLVASVATLLVASVSLQPGNTLGGTVLDVDGHPVADAYVSFQSDNPQIAYESGVSTDKAGHWAANVFPKDSSKITFSVVHREYAPFKSEPLSIDQSLRNQTAKLTLHFPLEFELTVTDAQTGQRLVDTKSFRIVPLTTPQLDDGPFNANGSSHTLNHGSGHGDFTFTFESRVTQGTLRIEADGYEPVTSPQITRDKDRKPVAFNAVLKRVVSHPSTAPASAPPAK